MIDADGELEPDPIYDGEKLCNKCMACVRDCPGNAISSEKTVKVHLAGKELEWGALDCEACSVAFRGAREVNHELTEQESYTSIKGNKNFTPGWWSPFGKKPNNLYKTGQPICGARGCTRACMLQLEKRGVLRNKFKDDFRRRKPWSVDWDSEPQYPDDAIMPDGTRAGNGPDGGSE